MKYLALIILAGCITACSSSKKADLPTTSEQDKFGKLVVNTLKTLDSTDYKSLFTTKAQLEASIKNSSLNEDQKKEQIAKVDSRMKEVIRSVKPSFTAIEKAIQKNGIDVKKIEFSRIETSSNQKNDITEGKLTIYFKFDDVEYKIHSEKCLLTNKGWKLLLPLKFIG